MARPKNSVPTYSHHKPSGQARVRMDGRDVYLGRYGSEESRREYARIVAEFGNSPVPARVGAAIRDVSVNEALVPFLAFAEQHYRRPDGTTTNEFEEYKLAIRPLRRLYGTMPAREFGPIALQAVRAAMIGQGWCRTRVNKQIGRLKRVFRWAVAQELVPVAVVQSLECVAGLQRGRTEARETEPIKPATGEMVDATIPYLWPTVRTMVQLQRLTGMRPGEVRALRPSEIDRSGEVWVYRPAGHKMAHAGRSREIPFGPRAQAVLIDFLFGEFPPPDGFGAVDLNDETTRLVAADAYDEAGRSRDALLLRDLARPVIMTAGCIVDPAGVLFTPGNAREERFAFWRRARRSKVPPSQQNRRKPIAQAKKIPPEMFTDHGYAAVVRRACARAGVTAWHPNQLRHAFASEVRRRYGLEAAQVLLGHAKADVTQVYAQRDHRLATQVAREMG